MAESKRQLVDWLDDLCVRFIINLPEEELESVARICFQVEEAQWFYEDFVRPMDPSLPSLNLRDFCLRIFSHCPLLSAFSDSQHLAAYQEFLAYKTRVPVRGAILLNHDMDQVVLVKGWKKSASWSFPRGKINKDERDLDCAIREVYEETGYDINAAGLVPDAEAVKTIDVTMREQHLRMFVFRGVPTDTYFEPRTRKEISKIDWYRLSDLPTFKKNKNDVNSNKFYMVAPFLGPLKKWINAQRMLDSEHLHSGIPSITHDGLSDAALDEPLAAPAPVDVLPLGSADPAAELRRLLSVGTVTQPVPDVASRPAEPKANTLLAMLRKNPMGTLAPSRAADPVPVTPMEQITGYPEEPSSPRYHRPTESPHIRRQPPPAFPFPSPNVSYGEQERPGFDPVAPFMAANGIRSSSTQAPQGLPSSVPLQWPENVQHRSMQQQPLPASFNTFPPSGVQLPLSHGPVAPKASQLPPPRLTNHTMDLLNAFRGGHNDFKTPDTAPPSLQSPLEFPGQSRNAHQNSLLDLFRSPAQAPAAPSMQGLQAVLPKQQAESVLTPAAVAGPVQPERDQPFTQRKASAVNMITRTLPRMKLTEPGPPVIPDRGDHGAVSKVAATPIQKTVGKRAEGRGANTVKPANRPPITILARPASSAEEPEKVIQQPSAPAPKSTPTPSLRSEAGITPAPFKILQRPASAKSVSSARTILPTSPAEPKPENQENFQPQLLRRSKPDETQLTQAAPQSQAAPSRQPEHHPARSGNQRDTLLSLFAKAPQAPASPTTSSDADEKVVWSRENQPSALRGGVGPAGPRLQPSQDSAPSRGPTAWSNFSAQAQAPESQRIAVSAEQSTSSPQQRWNETFKQVQVEKDWLGGPRKVMGREKTVHDGHVPEPIAIHGHATPRRTPFQDTPRSRLGSMVSMASDGTMRGVDPNGDGLKSPTTPVEAKGFLLDFLNGVVKDEHKGNKKRSG